MGRSDRRQKPKFEREPVEIKIAPFGLFAFHKNDLVKKEIWKTEDFAKNYLEREVLAKKFKSTIPIKAKYIVLGAFGVEAEYLARKHGIKFDFQKFMIDLTKLKIKTGFSKDKLVKQASNFYEEFNRIINMLYERLSEWYGLYWPESVAKVKSVEEFTKMVGQKRNGQSMGFDLDDTDLETIKVAGIELSRIIAFREKIGNYIEEIMFEIAPNTANIAGPILGAKLISIAGSLKNLSDMPSSTIQVLGAEKALFRHIRSGAKPPKYGILLSHNLMPTIKMKNRGKLARMIAAKISIAAKVDYYSKGKDLRWEEMTTDLNNKVKNLK